MNTIQQVFKRVEKKYLISTEQYNILSGLLEQHIQHDEYDQYTICNIYFDNDNYELIRTSIEKPSYKEKFRIRSYGVPTEEDKVFLEIKKKSKGVVYKRRVPFNLKDAKEVLNSIYSSEKLTVNIVPESSEPDSKFEMLNDYMNNQIMHEIEYVIKHYNLHPSFYIAYDRVAYVGKNANELRVTFDQNVRTRTEDLLLEKGDYGTRILDEGYYLMEIKTNGAVPLWLVDKLSELKIYPYSFSKYGTAYKRKIMEDLI